MEGENPKRPPTDEELAALMGSTLHTHWRRQSDPDATPCLCDHCREVRKKLWLDSQKQPITWLSISNAAMVFLFTIPISMIGFLVRGLNPLFGWIAIGCTFGIGVCTTAILWGEFRKEYSRTRCFLYLLLMCLMLTIWIGTNQWFFACIPGVALAMLIDRVCPH